MSAPEPIRVLVAEDEEPLRNAVVDLIASEAGLEVVGSAASADEAIELAGELAPDVAIVDVRMPGGGPCAALGICARSPATRVIALSAYEDRATVLEMLRCGAVGYLVKGIPPVELLEAIRRAQEGHVTFSIDVIEGVADELAKATSEESHSVVTDLRRTEQRFRALVESAPDGVVIADADGRIVLVNKQTERIFGYRREELLDQPIETVLPEHDPATAEKTLVGRCKDGREFPVEISLSAVNTEEGQLAIAFVRELTERLRIEEAQRRSDERLREVIESAPDAVIITDADGTIIVANQQCHELFGYPRDELLGKVVETLLPEAARDRHVRQRNEYMSDPQTRPMGFVDLDAVRRDGTEFPVDISLRAIDTDDGRVAIAFVRDMTTRRDNELAIKRLAAIVESSDDAIIGKALDGTILSWNRGAERMYGYSALEMVGKPISVLTRPDWPDEVPELIARLQKGEEIEQVETKRRRKDGAEIEVLLKISAVRDGAGQIVGSSSIGRDITQLKAHAELGRDLAERRALLARLVSAGEEERARIAGDIHDDSIQAITAASMRLQILRRKLDDPEQLKLLGDLEETIRLSIERLRHLLFELRPPVLDSEGLSAAIQMYLEDADEGSTTRYRLVDRLRSQPSAQTRTILYRIVQEALVNVRKHAAAASATVSLQETEGGYLVRIADDGVGFSVDEAKPVSGHLGLGAIRERAALAGGWMRIESAPEQGTTMEIWVPAFGPAGENGHGPTPESNGGTPIPRDAPPAPFEPLAT